MGDKFSDLRTCFRKNHNTQRTQLKILENLRKRLNNNNNNNNNKKKYKVDALFMGLSKVFCTLDSYLFIVNLLPMIVVMTP